MTELHILLMEILVILVASRTVGWLFRRIKQPQVIGEMVAGIMLGPSLLGWVAPDLETKLFPDSSIDELAALSRMGILLFMFLIGMELDTGFLRRQGRQAYAISQSSILAPFTLGALLAMYLYPHWSKPSVSLLHFTLFLGAAMSVTAFPVLARILNERKMLRTTVGALTIASAAIDDVSAWCILAVVVFLVRSSQAELPLWLTLGGLAVFTLAMMKVVQPLLRRAVVHYRDNEEFTHDALAVIFILVLVSAWVTERLGVHALFGAFVVGAVMPKDKDFVHELGKRVESVAVVVLLPLFFALTGLNTQITLLTRSDAWAPFALIMAAAIVGKFGGAAIAARCSGMRWREASAVGVLMNTRGLMELIILNVGLRIGVLSQEMFTMMVLMAIVTTFITSPLLEWIYPQHLHREVTDTGGLENATTLGTA